jgi:hypothetical protein
MPVQEVEEKDGYYYLFDVVSWLRCSYVGYYFL